MDYIGHFVDSNFIRFYANHLHVSETVMQKSGPISSNYYYSNVNTFRFGHDVGYEVFLKFPIIWFVLKTLAATVQMLGMSVPDIKWKSDGLPPLNIIQPLKLIVNTVNVLLFYELNRWPLDSSSKCLDKNLICVFFQQDFQIYVIVLNLIRSCGM